MDFRFVFRGSTKDINVLDSPLTLFCDEGLGGGGLGQLSALSQKVVFSGVYVTCKCIDAVWRYQPIARVAGNLIRRLFTHP